MFLLKRVFLTLLGALGTLFLDADPAYGLSKEEALKRCDARIAALEQQKDRFGDKIAGAYTLTLEDLKKLVSKLRESQEPPEIMTLYTTCQDGLGAIEWILDRYGKPPVKIETISNSSVASGNTPKTEIKPTGAVTQTTIIVQPPLETVKKHKKRKTLKPSVLKTNKKTVTKKKKLAPIKAKLSANKVSRNIGKAA
jgi:hypothetical protein